MFCLNILGLILTLFSIRHAQVSSQLFLDGASAQMESGFHIAKKFQPFPIIHSLETSAKGCSDKAITFTSILFNLKEREKITITKHQSFGMHVFSI